MSSAWSQLDQLLTCAICLDRYRIPKLLPCQHTFCMEPCLDGLIDYARRQIKCPECRAEHRIPYKGIQEFPTNVTLMRFLELHRDITGEEPEPPPSMMERCSVCSEKASLERCAHCEKKICPDCKEAHVDILRREINRINNQVRRGLHRLGDALTQTKKNADKLQQNCSQVKEEIEDIVRRYSKDLKHTEDKLKRDLEMYTEAEVKAITKLRDDLEAEVTTMTSNCDLVDKYIKDDAEWSDAELLEYKDIFLKTLDFLRTFDADTTDFSRRIKFQPRADPDVLHRNVADFGELKINSPPTSTVPAHQSTLAPTTSNALMRSQSDHRLAAQFARRANESRSFSDRYGSDNERETGRPTSPLYGRGRRETGTESSGYRRYSDRNRDYDYDRSNNRYGRDENSGSGSILSSRWRDSDDSNPRSRYNRDCEDYEPEQPHGGRTVRFADETLQRTRIFEGDAATKGPLSGIIKLMDSPMVLERLHQNEVKHKQSDKPPSSESNAPTGVPETRQQTQPSTPTVQTPRKLPSREPSEDEIDKQKKANQLASVSSSSASTPPSEATVRSTVRSEAAKPPPAVRPAARKETSESVANDAVPTPVLVAKDASAVRLPKPETSDDASEESDSSSSSDSSESRLVQSSLEKTVIPDSSESTLTHQNSEKHQGTSPNQLTSKSIANPTQIAANRSSTNDNFRSDEVGKPIQSSFFTRQRRLPDPEPRLLRSQSSNSDDEEDEEESEESEESEEEEEESEEEQQEEVVEDKSKTAETALPVEEVSMNSESEESSAEESTTSDSESEAIGERNNLVNDNDGSVTRNRSSGFKDALLDNTEQRYHPQQYTPKNDVSSKVTDSIVKDGRFISRRESEDCDATDSSSASSSTNYQSFSNNNSQLSNDTVDDNVEAIVLNGDSHISRRRPNLARSRSSHEIGLGYDITADDDDEDNGDGEIHANQKTRQTGDSDVSEPVTTRARPKFDRHVSVDSSMPPSTTSSWANYLKNKYGTNTANKSVPRSRSSHSLFHRSDSDSSEDDARTGRGASLMSRSVNYNNPRSTYLQKRRMLYKFGSRGSEPGNFTWPRGIAVGPDDSIAVADSSNHRVQVFDATGAFSFEFGSYGSCEGQFDCPAGVAVNRIGQYIVSDRYNQRVQLFDPSGRFLRAFGSEGRTDGRFNCPWGITTDSLGFIYVCDKENHRIQVFQSDGTFVGKFGALGSRPGQLENPHYIAVSNTNRVVVSDSNNHRIQIFDVNGRSLSSFGSEGSGEGQFKFPRGVAVDDQGYIIVGDSGNNRIQIFQPDGNRLREFGSWGSGEREFKGLEGIAVASSGNILVCDRENHRIQVF